MAKAKVQQNMWSWCGNFGKKRFPTFSILLLAIGLIWLLSDLGYIRADIPWWPVFIIALAAWGLIDYLLKK